MVRTCGFTGFNCDNCKQIKRNKMVLALIFLCLAIGCYSIRELHAHGKLKWMHHRRYLRKFWDEDSWLRKYELTKGGTVIPAPKTWYYRTFKIIYKERWPTSATFTVMFTDGPHLFQFFFFLFISLSLGIALELSWKGVILVWLVVHAIHFTAYRLLQK